MASARVERGFTATHHALLFAWISRAVLQRAGETQGERAVRDAVRRYGQQRGHRMALRAQASEHPLTMATYMAYGEWRAGEDEMDREILEAGPPIRALVHQCPWHTAWANNDLMSYGRLYCLEIDHALVRGFNPELRLDVNCTRTNGGAYCEFVYRDAEAAAVAGIHPPQDAVMGWEYHLGHLVRTMREVVVQALGPAGEDAIRAALADFSAAYGEAAVQAVLAQAETNFDRLPE